MILEHLQRVSDGARDIYHLNNLSSWIEKHIYLEGKLMNMSGKYSFQSEIVNNTSRVTNTIKCAQIGLSTATQAYFLAALATQRKFNAIYALPTASDAAKLTTTKVNPLIQGSPRLRNMLNKDVDSVELKQIGDNYLFTRGSKSETTALSISADCVVIDELDRCDPHAVKQFRSRLQASELGIVKQFSTPTIKGVGISKEAEASKRFRSMATCARCSHKWLPTYELDIRIPGYTGELETLDKHNIINTRWQESHWCCPNCGRDPKLTRKSLEWVCENPEQNYEAHTFYVNPVTCCEVLKPSYLVRTSTEFATRAEWKNQVLGIEAEDSNDQITESDVDSAMIQADLSSSDITYLGADMGLLCHIVVGRRTQTGEMLVIHREAVPVGLFNERRSELIRKYRCAVSVIDAFPYTPLVSSITDYDPNSFGADFSTGKSVELFTIKEKEANAEEGKLNLRLVRINRTRALDEVMLLFKERKILVGKLDDEEDRKFRSHVLSMKRTQTFKGDELVYTWQKTDGVDHYMLALLYMYIATLLRGTVSPINIGGVPLVSRFAIEQKKA
jgi:hypothetical protein